MRQLEAANELGYPVLLRPSYVIGGQNMVIAHNDEEVRRYMEIILSGKIENPVLVDQYLMGKELEVDVISDGTDVLIPGVMQHIERTASTPATPSPCTRPFPSGTRCSRPSWTAPKSWPCPSRPGGLSTSST